MSIPAIPPMAGCRHALNKLSWVLGSMAGAECKYWLNSRAIPPPPAHREQLKFIKTFPSAAFRNLKLNKCEGMLVSVFGLIRCVAGRYPQSGLGICSRLVRVTQQAPTGAGH